MQAWSWVGVLPCFWVSQMYLANNIRSLNILQSFTGMNVFSNNGPIYAFNSRVEFNGSTKLSNNRGELGGAISAVQSEIYINTELRSNHHQQHGYLWRRNISEREYTLFVSEPVKIYHNTAQDGGGIYAYSSGVEFQPLVPMVKDSYPNKQSEITHNIAE